MLPTNQPTATGVALCHEKAGGPQFKKINNRHGISGFHRASLLSVTFINQLMHSIITIVDDKICIIQKSKRHTLKYSNMIHHQGLMNSSLLKLRIMVQLCLLCAWSEFGGICRQTPTTHIISTIETLYVISIK